MTAAAVLELLKEKAASGQVPLHEQYMAILRQSFCHLRELSPLDYISWISESMGLERITTDHPAAWIEEPDEVFDLPILLSLGDSCAAEQVRTGSYYTPDGIALFMAHNALWQTLNSRFPEAGELIDRFFEDKAVTASEAMKLQEMMGELRILDMACGNGVFLRACLDCYCRVAKVSGEDVSGLHFVAESLCAIDIRPDALESWLISLGHRSSDFVEASIPLKLACVSSVDGDAVLGISWVNEILASGGFDLVIGNPPYLGEKGNKSLFENLRQTPFGKKYYEGRMDLFYYFLHRGIELLKAGGILCQLTTSYYATADFATGLRTHLRSAGGITGLVAFNDQRVFSGAMGHHLILFFQKNSPHGSARIITYTGSQPLSRYAFEDLDFRVEGSHYQVVVLEDRGVLFDGGGYIVLDPARWETDILERLSRACRSKLKDVLRINQGIVSGADRSPTGGIFVLEKEEVFEEAKPWLVPWYKNGDIRRYRTAATTDKQLIYIGNEPETALSPELLRHFEPYRGKLNNRRECLSGARPWYGLQWPRERTLFEGPKLVVPQRSFENRFAYNEEPWFASADVYFLTRPAEGISLWALLAWLNSDILYHWFLHCGKRKGKQLELYATPLGNAPVNEEWLAEDGELHRLGKALYDATGNDEELVKQLRQKVDCWIEHILKGV